MGKCSIVVIVLIYVSTFSLVGIVYFAIPGYPHALALGDALSVQPTGIFACSAGFLSSFFSAVYITPRKQ